MTGDDDIVEALDRLRRVLESRMRLRPVRVKIWVVEEEEPMQFLYSRYRADGPPANGADRNGDGQPGGKVLFESPAPSQAAADSKDADFEPTDFQVSIYHALEYHAYHAEDLAAELDCDRRTLWKKNGIKELMAIGWVAIDKSPLQLGYFRPDAPPPELRRDSQEQSADD